MHGHIDLGMELDARTLITSKTDLNGKIVYCNKDFIRYSGYNEQEVFLKPHNIVRHADMPRAVFKLLWQQVSAGKEVFAFVKNKTKAGGHYWVFANITPSFDERGKVVGYYSVRRKPNARAIRTIAPLYAEMRHTESTQGLEASLEILNALTQAKAMNYNELMLSLQRGESLETPKAPIIQPQPLGARSAL